MIITRYSLNNLKEVTEYGVTILKTKKFNNISFVWNFISLAKRCEGIKEQNIYFANNLEYYLGGGSKVDNPQIRIFSLNDSSPWRDSDLGIVPNMDWAKQYCEFY